MKMYNNIFISRIISNMYVGYWKSGFFYKKQEIVYVEELKEYFICILEHISDDVTLPSKDDLYWIYVSSVFLSQLGAVNYSNMLIKNDTLPNGDANGRGSKKRLKKQKLKIKTSDIKNYSDSDVEINTQPTSNVNMSDFDLYDNDNKENDNKENDNKENDNKENDNKENDETFEAFIKKSDEKDKGKNIKSYSDQECQNVKMNDLKRKLRMIEQDLDDHKKKKYKQEDEITNLKDKLLLMDIDLETKSFIMDKYENTKKLSGSDYAKGMNWLKTVNKIPYGKYKNMAVSKNDSTEKIKNFFTNVKQKLDKNIYGLEDVKQEILEFVAKRITNPDSKGHVLALYGSAGLGKCFQKDTPILMFDGSIKMVQDIVPGELLMGDDSTPRTVLALGNGRDTMYKITNVKGETYTVNSEHILCLKYSTNKHIVNDKKAKRFRVLWFNHKTVKLNRKDFYYKNESRIVLQQAREFMETIKEEKICEISVKKYLKLSDTIKNQLKGYSVPVNFVEKELDFDPYIIGLWLGDGSSDGTGICSQDATILKYLSSKLPQYNCYLQYNNDKYDYRINGLKSNGKLGGNNRMLNTLKKYDLIKNKHIPHIYKCNSRENRLKLLAGLIDSDGSLSHDKSGYEFSQSLEHEQIIDDIIYLARSLGFACYKKRKHTSWTYKGIKNIGEAWRIFISGEGIEEIPVLCPRKKANPRKQRKDVLVSGIHVEELQKDDYYGFMIDGNERFVLGNFIVTHNTKIIRSLADALELPFYQINFGGLNDVAVLTGHSETYVGSKPGKVVEILSNSEYMNPIIYMDEIDKIGEQKATEIFGVLTHLLDEEQNSSFQDNYLSNINIDLSKVFFVLSFNDITKVDEIVSDRLKVIYINPPSLEEKVIICQDKMIPEILSNVSIRDYSTVILDKEIIEYIISSKTQNEKGVRQLRKNIEKIINRLNYDVLLENLDKLFIETNSENEKIIVITRSYINDVLKHKEDTSYLSMYS